MTAIVSLDIGTSKLCALALKQEGLAPLAVRCRANDADVPGLPAGYHEQDPLLLCDRAFGLLSELLADEAVRGEDIRGLAITGQMHGLLLVDPNLRPVTNLITWRDHRVLQAGRRGSLDEAIPLLDVAGPARTGCRLHAGYGGATLFHLVQNGKVDSDCKALAIADFIAARLSGVAATEPTHAASWGLLNLHRDQWDEETVRRLALPENVLPAIRRTSRPLGVVRPDVARSVGLPSGTQVCAPIGDNQASILGVVGLASNAAVVNIGTGAQLSIPKPAAVWIEGFETRPMPFGGQVLVAASLCGGWSYAYLRQFFQDVVRQFADVDLSDRHVYERMNRLAAEAAATLDGLSVDTRFGGTREVPSLRGAVNCIDTQNLTAGNLARSFVVGMVQELAEMFRHAGDTGVTRIIASGNAVRENPLMVEIIESLFHHPCQTSFYPEEAALGAAYAAMVGMGMVPASGIRPRDASPHRLVPHFHKATQQVVKQ